MEHIEHRIERERELPLRNICSCRKIAELNVRKTETRSNIFGKSNRYAAEPGALRVSIVDLRAHNCRCDVEDVHIKRLCVAPAEPVGHCQCHHMRGNSGKGMLEDERLVRVEGNGQPWTIV